MLEQKPGRPIAKRDFLKWLGVVGGMALHAACRPVLMTPKPSAIPRTRPPEEGALREQTTSLPPPVLKGLLSLEEMIKSRRSKRDFRDRPLSLEQVSQLLWAAQSITEEAGFKRAAPSAGATYPLDAYLVAGKKNVDGLQQGVYHYLVREHSLRLHTAGDLREALAQGCLGQMFVASAPIIIVLSAEYTRTTGRYRQRGTRYVHMEVGHAGQNIYLQAEALGLVTVAIGAFADRVVSSVLHLPEKREPLYVMPVGYGY